MPTETAVAPSFALPDCSQRGVRFVPADACVMKQHLLGLWARCAPSDGGVAPLAAPLLELRADSWHLLEPTPDGGLVRRLDIDGSGVVEISNTASSTGDFQVIVQTTNGGWLFLHPTFEVGPERLRLTSYPAEPVDYGRISTP